MINLIFKYWYRKQETIENEVFFKIVIVALSIVVYIFSNIIFLNFINIDNKFESFIILNVMSSLFTQYNVPIIKEELKSKSIIVNLNIKHISNNVIFIFAKRNILILIFLLIIISNISVFIFKNSRFLIMLLTILLVQVNFCILRLTNKKNKIILLSLILIEAITIYINKDIYLIISLIANVFIYKKIVIGTVKYLQIKSDYRIIISNNSIKVYLNYLIKYFRRINISEYISIIFMLIVSMILYKFTNIRNVEYLILIIYMAKIQLIIDSKQIYYNKTYLKNCFFNSIKVTNKTKIMYSYEFKSMIFEIITIILLIFIRIYFEGIRLNIFLWGINLFLLLIMITIKLLNLFLLNLDNKSYFKTTGITIIIMYVILFVTNLDWIFKKINISISNGITEIIKFSIIFLCLIIKFENIFKFKIERGYEFDAEEKK